MAFGDCKHWLKVNVKKGCVIGIFKGIVRNMELEELTCDANSS